MKTFENDTELLKALRWSEQNARDEDYGFDADLFQAAADRLEELKSSPDLSACWISTEVELPPEDDIVLAVVNGKLGSITFINSIEPAQYFDDEGWLLESFIDVCPGGENHIDIKWWMPMPSAPKNELREEW